MVLLNNLWLSEGALPAQMKTFHLNYMSYLMATKGQIMQPSTMTWKHNWFQGGESIHPVSTAKESRKERMGRWEKGLSQYFSIVNPQLSPESHRADSWSWMEGVDLGGICGNLTIWMNQWNHEKFPVSYRNGKCVYQHVII